MATVNFAQTGSFNGVVGGNGVLQNPTSLQFGADGRLYVSEQDGTINAFTVVFQNGEFVAVDHEVLTLAGGGGVVQSIQNHNDDGTLSGATNRQVTGLVVAGTADNPVLYISSSDPRIATNNDINLDTNSGIITRVTWTGTEWVAVDIIRGLPRSEENHSVNGLVLSEDGNSLFAAVGGNTNNGAPSQFFANTPEFALSGTILEIDLEAIAALPVNVDPNGGQGGVAREFVYDLPTLDDPTVANITDGVGEDEFGLDEAGPFGGNDGLNQAILPADAPLRIFADGLRNNFDLVLTEGGQLFTVDNGSNSNLGGNPIVVNGEPTSQINNGGTGDPEPLFRLDEGAFFGHANPVRANQDQEFSIFDDAGNAIVTVPNLADLVPDGVAIADGFVIDPSRFTGDPTRLAESGVRVPFSSDESPALATVGSSSNGLVEFTNNAFNGALQGALLVAQFNGNVTVLNVNDEGTALEPLIDPGLDGVLGTADDEVLSQSGIFPLITGQALPLDVTVDPNGNIFVAELGGNNINVFSPSGAAGADNEDFDNDGILNINDPFQRDATNGGSAILTPGQSLVFDLDPDQDGNLVGPSGFSGGLTGVAVNGVTDFEEFFLEPSPRPATGQIINLDNVKFATAAGGGTTVIEFASNGTPDGNNNNGEFLFQTGITVSPLVESFNVRLSVFNPAAQFTGASQQIGGFIGTGDQSNFLKFVATPSPNGEIQIVLENNDVTVASSFIQADGLFSVPPNQQIFFDIEIDRTAATATPTITYETGGGNTETVTGGPIDLSGTAVLDAILGNASVDGQTTGLAIGLLSSNFGQAEADAFAAVFNDIEITANSVTTPEPQDGTVLFRVNAGGPEVAALDGGIAFSADTAANNSPFLLSAGSNRVSSFPAVNPGPTASDIPDAIFNSERFDFSGGSSLQYAFDVPDSGLYEVRLFLGNGFNGTQLVGQRSFDVAVEGTVTPEFDDIDLVSLFGHQVGGVLSSTVEVTDGTLNLEFLHGVENPLVNGIEIIQLDANGSGGSDDEEPDDGDTTPPVALDLIIDPTSISENGGQATGTVTLSSASTEAVTVTLTSDDVSEASVPTTVEIAAGDTSATFSITGVDDDDVDGTQAISITATSTGLVPATAALDVTDDDVVVTPPPTSENVVLFRVNAGGPEVAALDGGIAFSADTAANNSPFLLSAGSNRVSSFPAVNPGPTASDIPDAIFNSERFDFSGGSSLQYAFDVPDSGLYEVRLFLGNGFNGTQLVGQRSFDVAVEGTVTPEFDDIDLISLFGHRVGGVLSSTVEVTDGTLNLEFLHGVENPLVNGIEIIQLKTGEDSDDEEPDDGNTTPPVTLDLTVDSPSISENGGQATGTVTLSAASNEAVTVTLTSDDVSEASVPTTVEIAAGDTSATFSITGVDDDDVDGTQAVSITATATDLAPATAALDVTDDDVVVTPPPTSENTVLFRVNAGGPEVAALDGGIAFSADTAGNNSPFLLSAGSNRVSSFPAVNPGPTASDIPDAIFNSERFDFSGGSSLQYAFDVPDSGLYEVRLFLGNGFNGTQLVGQRSFDVAVEGTVTPEFDDIDLISLFGHRVGGVLSSTVEVTDGTLNLEFLHGVENPLVNGIEIIQLGTDGGGTPPSNEPPAATNGEAVLSITVNSNNVQQSSFGNNSFSIENRGDLSITSVEIDISNALFSDSVFDPFGLAGDTVSRGLTINTPGGTGAVSPTTFDPYSGTGGTEGFTGLQLLFDETVDGGFETGETVGFAVDIDPNSIAGATVGPLTAGTSPNFDVGGVSGAELIGSEFTVTFEDGSTATGQLQGANNQAGARGIASQNSPNASVSLTANNVSAGGVGSYSDGGPTVIINGDAGQTARIVLAKGVIQPVTNEFFNSSNPNDQQFAPILQAQLDALATADFPANNAIEFQTVDIALTGADQDISNLFNFEEVAAFDFPGEDQLPLGLVASVIDPADNDLSLGPVSAPIYLQFDNTL